MKPQGPVTGPFLIPGDHHHDCANSTSAARCPSPLVLFGIDNRGKPKGARFGKEHASLAMKAATQLQLQVLASNDPKVAEIAARLPVGRVHATGRAFVPFIRRDLYDQLLAAAAANGNARPTSPPNGSSGALGSTPGGSAPHLPQNWQRSASAIWSLLRKVLRTAGTRQSSSRQTATCSHYAGVTSRGNAGLRAIGCGSDCSIPGPDRPRRPGNQRKPQAKQSTTNLSQ